MKSAAMTQSLIDSAVPHEKPPLDDAFRPAFLANREFQRAVAESGKGVPLVLGLERSERALSRFETTVFPDGHPNASENLWYAERLLKFLLWARGAWRVYVGGPESIVRHLKETYSPKGARGFDFHFMGEDVYRQTFTIVGCEAAAVPAERHQEHSLGRHLRGCRIGFDLGASDLKVSAVVDGQPVFSKEIEWQPRDHHDPRYHRHMILSALHLAAAHLPRIDAIGGSSAGVYVDSQPRIASLFRGIPKDRYGEVREMFVRMRSEFGVPLDVVNDGEVTALAGSMSLEDDSILGVALGSSEAAGYITPQGNITDWLNELAFAPIDYADGAPADEWSGDRGCGVQYFSQQCVFRLAPKVGITIPAEITPAKKLELVQQKLDAGHEGARRIWETMGVYMGYGIAHYAQFYSLKHVLILGRCTSGSGGQLILDGAKRVLQGAAPELARRVNIQLPDEKSRRVGQSIAAASLPVIAEEVAR
jgi:predicted NBD/HSP70 family sugar kinase